MFFLNLFSHLIDDSIEMIQFRTSATHRLFVFLVDCQILFEGDSIRIDVKDPQRQFFCLGSAFKGFKFIFRIVALLAGEFTVIAGTAVVIAWPAALLTMTRVLADSPYRIPLSLWVFAAGGAVVIALTLATVGLHAVKAAVRNPVESLRHE